MQIAGKTVLITGAGGGIGRAAAVLFARRGARMIVLADLDPNKLEESGRQVRAAGAEARIRRLDVTDFADFAKVFQEGDSHGGLDVVFNNAGIVTGAPPFPETSIERIVKVINVNLTAVVVATKLAAEYMAPRGGGVVINTCSTGALRTRLPNEPYNASKAGVLMFSRSCKDLADSHNVRVNAVLPGVTNTPLLDQLGKAGDRPDWYEALSRGFRILEPEDVAEAVLELIEDDTKAGDYVVLDNEPLESADATP